MKRKLSAIIALVLAVVMVFPAAVFVGAADPAPAITAKLGDADFASGGTITVPVDVSATLNLVIPNGYTKSVARTKENGASLMSESGSAITFTGNREDKIDTYTITATKTGAANLTFTVNVACVPVTLVTDSVKLTGVTGGSGTFDNGRFDCVAGTEITGATLSGTLNNGNPAVFKNIKFSLNETSGYTDKLKVTANDNGANLYIQYEVEGVSDTFEPVQTILIVTGMAVDAVVAEAGRTSHEESSISKTDFVSGYVNVKAEMNGRMVGISTSDATFTFYNGQTAWNGSEITRDNIGNLTFMITYEGVDSVKYNVSDFVSLDGVEPDDIRVDLNGISKKDYVAGEKITEITISNAATFITVLDSNGQPINNNDLYFKSISFAEFTFGSASVEVTVIVNGKTFTKDVPLSGTGITVSKRSVTGIAKSTRSTMKTSYDEGDALDLNGLIIEVKYNFGESEHIQYSNFDFTCNPQAGAILNSSDKSLLVVYKDPASKQEFTCSIPLDVKAASSAKEIKEVRLLSSSGAKRDYFIGEAFDPKGFEILVVYTDASTDVKDLSETTNIKVESNRYNNTSKEFTNSLNSDLTITFTLQYKSGNLNKTTTKEVVIPDITVTKRPILESIVATTTKVVYMEGEAPQVKDFVITAKYDDRSQRVFEVEDDVTGATRSTYNTTVGGVTYTLKLTPTIIDADTTEIKVAYSERVSGSTTVTKNDEVEIEVTVPDAVLTYYDTTERTYVTEAFEDLYDALEKAEEIADSYTTSYSSRIPEVELRRDVTMVADFPSTESINIDLNGHTLTMIRGEISVSTRAGSDVEIVFSNTSKTDAKLVYSGDEDDTVIIAYNDTYTIDRDTSDAGKYDVVISSVKNGKVTGPSEVTHGHDAQFTITPDEDYEISTIKVNNKTYSIPTDGKLIVENVQEKLTVTVTFKEKAWDNPFTDVYKSATYYKSIQFVYENGLFTGTSATKFEPDTTMTRAMFVTVLGRLADVNVDNYQTSSFTDVPTGEWYSEYVQWASSIGLVEGYGNGKFGPNDPITHAQMYVLMQRYALLVERKSTNAAGTNIAANDVKDIPDWAYEGVEYAAKNAFLITSSNRLTPNANAKRSELAMLLDKFCVNVLGWDE